MARKIHVADAWREKPTDWKLTVEINKMVSFCEILMQYIQYLQFKRYSKLDCPEIHINEANAWGRLMLQSLTLNAMQYWYELNESF